MFAIIHKEDLKLCIIAFKSTLDEAKILMKAEALKKYGSDKLDIIEKLNTVEVKKTTVQNIIDPGWLFNGTKQEIKTELVAEYLICEVSDDAKNEFGSLYFWNFSRYVISKN